MNRIFVVAAVFLVTGCQETVVPQGSSRAPQKVSPEIVGDVLHSPQGPHLEERQNAQRGEQDLRNLEVHHVSLNPLTPVELYPSENEEEPETEGLPMRHRKRMNIDQLNRAMLDVTGGLTWTDRSGNTPRNLFEELSLTLGRPDYVQIIVEDLSPSGLFLKFMDDAARSVCRDLVEAEVTERDANSRVLLGAISPDALYDEAPVAIDAQLARLVLKYHGVKVQAHEGSLENLRWLFQLAQHRMAKAEAGWEAVCVSLMTDPAFYSY